MYVTDGVRKNGIILIPSHGAIQGCVGQELHDLFIVTEPVGQSNTLAALLS
jgi:hypothetical protein